ncbi:glycosyltransferase [Variovorax sp. VRV01]|uniref:glycosyltransferase n=1 Tax=Variovorax sp. VRV01 TaxID=2769259 RepID=UPI00177A7D6E|nr:glycosyltransferase [Variovorax sp. VRV01]MBD9663186.1 glycosyltransferase [Variovorax sp. VRV01]
MIAGFYLPGFKGGGPIRTIANIVDHLGEEVDFSVITGDRDLGDLTPYSDVLVNDWNKVGSARVFYLPAGLASIWSLIRLFLQFEGAYIYLNSFFSFRFSIFPILLWRLLKGKRRVLIAPRGEFSEGALAIRHSKKLFFIALAKFFGIYGNVVWHASTEHEVDDIRRLMGGDANVQTAINISRPPFEVDLMQVKKGSPLRIVFVSRISQKKNLLGAIEMLKMVRCSVVFDVYGPAEDSIYWENCESAAKGLPEHIKFNYRGAMHPAHISGVLVDYDLFYLPTLGENFGHVIAEALGCGLPVLISDMTPWRDLEAKGIGWDVPLRQPALFAECIEICSRKTTEQYRVWRDEVRAWALKNIGNIESIEQNRRLFLSLSI